VLGFCDWQEKSSLTLFDRCSHGLRYLWFRMRSADRCTGSFMRTPEPSLRSTPQAYRAGEVKSGKALPRPGLEVQAFLAALPLLFPFPPFPFASLPFLRAAEARFFFLLFLTGAYIVPRHFFVPQ